MSILTEIILGFFRSSSKYKNVKASHIFYKIVDSTGNNGFLLQCINTNALFFGKITDIIFDTDILYGLHPVQSCFIGIEYAKYIKKYEPNLKGSAKRITQYSLSRYGCYSICYQNRDGKICFLNNLTNERFVMDPRDIALSEELINEFDATHAFYIGLSAGLKINNTVRENGNYSENKRQILYLIK